MARLDRIPEVKEVAQIAACIGREFDFSLLASVADHAEPDLFAALDKLAAAELIFRRGASPAATYTFKHALVQDAAYQSLLKSRRQHLHARIAKMLEHRFPERSDTEPELLAHHHAAAGDMGKAFHYWLEAGHRAAERSAHLEAIQHLIKARDYLATLPDSSERTQQELDVLMTLGPAFTATKGFAAAEVEQIYGRVREVCRIIGEADRSRAALQALRVLYMTRGNLVAAADLGEELLATGERDGSPRHQFDGHLALGIVNLLRGQLAAARRHLEQALTLHEPGLGALAHQPLGVPGVICLGHLATVLFLLGFPEQSLQRRREAFDMARASSHPFSLAQALGITGMVSFFGHQFVEDRNAAALVALAEEHQFDFWYAQGLAIRGWASAAAGRTEPALADLRDATAAAEAIGAPLVNAFALTALAATLGRNGEVAEAFSVLAEQRQLANRTGIAFQDAPVRLLEGELRLKLPEHDSARVEACFEDALTIARQQESRILELRAATSLAKLWADQGRRSEAHDLLAPIYAWFTEGFDTADLKDAKALLDDLA
jgi:predicted ATPase